MRQAWGELWEGLAPLWSRVIDEGLSVAREDGEPYALPSKKIGKVA